MSDADINGLTVAEADLMRLAWVKLNAKWGTRQFANGKIWSGAVFTKAGAGSGKEGRIIKTDKLADLKSAVALYKQLCK